MTRSQDRPVTSASRALTVLVVTWIFSMVSITAFAYQSRPGFTERASVSSDGSPAETNSQRPAISAGGRFVGFESKAENLVPGLELPNEPQAFVHDRETGETEIVSISSQGEVADDWITGIDISSDGRYVIFDSMAKNLVPESPRYQQVYLHDRATGVTELVSRTEEGEPANRTSWKAAISGDGRFVTYQSYASNLVSGTTPERVHIYLFDRSTGEVELISRAPDGTEANNFSAEPAITSDGRFVSYNSLATNLVSASLSPLYNIFVHDRETDQTELVSVSTGGEPQDEAAFGSTMSADGRYVAYQSNARNLAPANSYDTYHVYVRDRVAGTTERVSVSSDGVEGSGSSEDPVISGDGRFVTYMSYAFNLTPEEELNPSPDIYVYDRGTKTTEIITVAADGGAADLDSYTPDISQDGRVVVFETIADNLIPNDTNNRREIFVRERGPATGIGELTLVGDEGTLTAEGWATFSGALVSAGDAQPSASDPVLASADVGITGASVIYRAEREDLLFRTELEKLSSDIVLLNNQGRSVTARPPTIVYGWAFDAAGASWEVRAQRLAATAPTSSIPWDHGAKLFRCEPDCTAEADLRGGVGTAGIETRAGLPLDAIGLEPGDTLTNIHAFAAPGELTAGYVVPAAELALPDAALPVPTVELGVSPTGSVPEDVTFDIQADLQEGRFTTAIDAASLSSGSDLWAKACLGATCGVASVPLPGAEPSPAPTTSPTAVPTEEPSPSPSQSPSLQPTAVAFTERSASSGQYSDETTFEAQLTDSSGDPIAAAEVVFELTGSESARSFDVTTDSDGVASVSPTLIEKPGPHQLTVRYAGDDDHAGDADTVSFVVDKEDSALELSVHGEDDDKTLRARLSDLDTSSEGIPQRTIHFYSDGELIGSLRTDADGVASVALPPRHRGNNRTYEAVFEGDDFYLGSSAEPTGKGKGKGGNGGGRGGN